MQVAKTILEQLGGAGRLQVMTGAYNFVAYPNGVSFKFKNRKVNYVKITLNGMDLYDIEFLKLTVNSQKKVAEFEDIYFDQLIDIFEETTGMYLRLFAKGGRLKKDENLEMIFGQLKQIHHHEKELRSIIKKDKSIEPWVIAKLQRATTDLSDVTHYEDNKTTKFAKGGGIGKYKKVMIGDNSVLQNPGITLYNKDSIYLKMINNGPNSYYAGNIYRFEKNGINIYIIPQRKTDGSGKYNSVFWYTEEGKNEGNLKNIDWEDSNAYNKFKEYEKNKDWESIAKMFDYIMDSEVIVKNDKFEEWYKNYLKNPEIEKLPLSQKTRLKLAPIYFMYYYAKGGGVVNYPSFEISKGIPYDGKFLNPGYYTYIDREVGGKGVYINIMNRETTGFSIEDLKLIQEKYPDNFSITFGSMATGGEVTKPKMKGVAMTEEEDEGIDNLIIYGYDSHWNTNFPTEKELKETNELVKHDKNILDNLGIKYKVDIDDDITNLPTIIIKKLLNKPATIENLQKLVSIKKDYGFFDTGGSIEDDITRAKSNATDKIDFEYYAKQHAGDSWNTMSKQEKAELISELRDNWFNDSYAKGGNIYNYLVGTDFKYLKQLHKIKKVENYPTYTTLVTTENRRFRMDILQEQGVQFADKPARKKREPLTSSQLQLKNAQKIKELERERKQVEMDMEQEAEPEGGPIANRYGRLLNSIDKKIDLLKHGKRTSPMTYQEAMKSSKKANGGNIDSEKPLIYFEDFDAQYSGKSFGQWLDLSKYNSGIEVMEAISDIATDWSKRKGEKIETISVTDYENIPRSLYHEFMSISDYDFIIKAYKVSKELNLPMWVVGDVMSDYSDSFEHTIEGIKEFINENYLGFAEDDSDLAYDYIEKNGGIKSLAEEMIKRNFDYEKYGRDVRLGMDSVKEEELGYDKLDDYDLGKELVEQYSDIREIDENTLKSNFKYKLFGDYLTSYYANYGGHYFRN